MMAAAKTNDLLAVEVLIGRKLSSNGARALSLRIHHHHLEHANQIA
jgi:hypothetical protein